MGLAALALPAAAPPRPWLVWNATASSPVGLYRVERPARVPRGALVVAWPPPAARALGAARHYFPRNVPLVKRVAAIAGDTVCAQGDSILVDGLEVARRRRADPSGRPLPWWNGCERLRGGDLFLLTAGRPDAFDGRYFGVTGSQWVVGRASLLWAR